MVIIMNKKIIAILLVFVLVVTCFAACQKKKLDTVKINGENVALATDKDGNTIVNDDNQIAVLVTDADGKIIKYENGEDQTRWVEIKGTFSVEGYLIGENYRLAVPEGWASNDSKGRIIKDNTDDMCYLRLDKVKNLEDNENLDAYLAELDEQESEAFSMLEEVGYTVTVDKKGATISDKGLKGILYVYKIVDADGKTVHYAESGYFTAGKAIYNIVYVCENGKGYDETFDFAGYMKNSVTVR